MTENLETALRGMRLGRRSFLKGIAGVGAMAFLPRSVLAADVADAGTVTLAVSDIGDGILDITATTEAGEGILDCMYDSFFEIDQDGHLAPGIVKAWQLSDDKLSWTFHLRDDVYFHPGKNADGSDWPKTKMTSADVAFSLAYNARDAAHSHGTAQQDYGNPPKVDIVDDYTVIVHTPQPQPNMLPSGTHFFDQIMFLVPKAYIEKNGEAYLKDHPIGTGPYMFVSSAPGDSMQFHAVDFPHWTGVVPAFKTFKVVQVPEEATMTYMLKQGDVDASAVSLEAAKTLKAAGVTILDGSTVGTLFSFYGTYLPQTQGKPLADVRVRQALSLAINRQEIVNNLLGGIGQVPDAPPGAALSDPDMTPALVAKWKPWFENAYRYDLDEAKKLLSDAGVPNGFSFDFWSAPDGAAPYLADLIQVCASYWKAIGVTATIIPVDENTFSGARNTSKSTALIGKAGANATTMNRPVSLNAGHYFLSKGGPTNLLVGSPLEAQVDDLYNTGYTLQMGTPEYDQALDKLLEITTGSWTTWSVVASPLTFAFGPRVIGRVSPGAQHIGYDVAWFKPSGK